MAVKKNIPSENGPPPKPPATPAGQPGYATSLAHLKDHLGRIDLLVKAHTIRWRYSIAAGKPENFWGMIHVTEQEVHAFLKAPFGSGDGLPDEAGKSVAELGSAAQAMLASIQARERNTPPEAVLRLRRLQEIFSLSPLERDLLLTCLLPETDPRYRRLFGYLQDDASRTQPTVELTAAINSPDGNGLERARPCFDASGPLLSAQLLIVRAAEEEPLPVRSLRVDDRIAAFLLGSDAPEGRLRGIAAPAEVLDWSGLVAEAQHVDRLQGLAQWWFDRRPPRGAALFMRGTYGSGKLASARVFSTALKMPLWVVDVPRALHSGLHWEQTVRLAFREALLRGAAIYWSGCESLLAREQTPGRWNDLVAAAESFPGLVFFASTSSWEPAGNFLDKPFLRVDIPGPSYKLRKHLWELHMPPPEDFGGDAPDPAMLAEALANRFPLTEGQIVDAIRAAHTQALRRNPRQRRVTAEDLYEGCRRQSGQRLLTFSKRIEPRADLDFADLVLPEVNLRQLREVQERIRMLHKVYSDLGFEHRLRLGRGLIVLFTGSSGTGKTMAAEWLARELGVDLYRADLSSVVSKWVGDTEKNLNQLFAEAEDSSAIIFFDEADALFGKRGEVKDARDRWANTEVNYLLQRVEEYSGVVILASNLRQNIDEAFLRRINVMVEFPAPDEAARLRIWKGMFPPGLKHPREEELQSLAARIRLPGGSVRNIVLDAVFRALADSPAGEPALTLRHLVIATGREYQKMGRPITKSEFGDTFYVWIEEEIL